MSPAKACGYKTGVLHNDSNRKFSQNTKQEFCIMEDFLFHKLSENGRGEIKKKAKDMLDSFSEKISREKVSEAEPVIIRKEYEREEKEGQGCDDSFREIMFENAPDKNKDFLIAEKKKWE